MGYATRLCTHVGEPHPRGTCPSKHDYSKCCPHKILRGISRTAQGQRERRLAIRAEVLAAYGGQCACCGESTPNFLGLDHKNGDGVQHRATLDGRKTNMYYWAKRNYYPDLLQLLCWNCNYARNFFGKCHG